MPGLADFDADAASRNLAAVGQGPDLYALADQADQGLGFVGPPAPVAVPAPVVEAPAIPVPAAAAPEVVEAAPAPAEIPPVTSANSDLPPVAAAPSAITDLPGNSPGSAPTPTTAPVDVLSQPPPAAPFLTGDPTVDVQANLEWQRSLAAHHEARNQEVLKRSQSAAVQNAARDVAVATEEKAKHDALRLEQVAARKAAQSQVDTAVAERVAAMKDLDGPTWQDQHAGLSLAAAIAGGVVQGLQNAAAAQLGQVGTAQNEAVKTIDRIMQREYEKKKARLAAMSDSLAEARHGYADTMTNQVAAQNDLDADFAARWRLVGKEAEHRLRQQGVDEASIKANAVIQAAQAGAAQHEGEILNREAQRQEQRQHNAATEAMAAAHLGQAERQIEATIADRADNRADRRSARAETRADRLAREAAARAAAAEKAADKAEKRDAETEIFDPATSKKLGNAGTPAAAQHTRELLRGFESIKGDMIALRKHVTDKETGGVVAPFGLTEASRDRRTLADNLVTSMSGFKGLGAISKDDRKIIEGIVSGGTSAILGMNGPQLDRMLAAVERARASTLQSQGIKAPDAAPAPAKAPNEPAAAKPAEGDAPKKFEPLSRAQQDELERDMFRDPDPARRKRARDALDRRGLLPR